MPDEQTADLTDIGAHVSNMLEQFQKETGRDLHLEIEPGTFLTAGCGVLVAAVIDITDTGEEGYNFIRLDTGMNDILRPTMYGSLHPLHLHPKNKGEGNKEVDYVVIGHNCESGDLLTPVRGNSEELMPRRLPQATIGDLLTIGAAGAYCASMRAKGYNFFKSAEEVFVE
jgi:diaminopimelate decarboxylase